MENSNSFHSTQTCQYQEIQGNFGHIARHVRCVHCGHIAGPLTKDFPLENFQQSVARICPSPTQRFVQPLPSLMSRLIGYNEAFWREQRPASEDVLMLRFEKCSTCPQYNDLLGACSVCGCWVNLLLYREGFNKLANLAESCALPAGEKRWDKID